MAEENEKPVSSGIVVKAESETPNNPIVVLVSNFIRFLQSNLGARPKEVVAEAEKSPSTNPLGSEEGGDATPKPMSVKFAQAQQVFSPLMLEAEDAPHSTSPAVLWQVYALGGFIVLKWVWARWKERVQKNESSDDDQGLIDD